MITQDQSGVVAFLSDPANHGGEAVKRIETHASIVFLADGRAWKLKRAVKLPYLDYSTPQKRLAACQREVELNRLTAPGLYLGARPIIADTAGRLHIGGEGELVDAVIEMERFRQHDLYDNMAREGRLEAGSMPDLARSIAQFHAGLQPVHGESGSANIAAVLDINEAGFATSNVFATDAVARLSARFRAALSEIAADLDHRERLGRIRRCHGDLHLRNICLHGGKPVLFDCIEFSDRIATIDVLYDLAFLLMDLWHRELRQHASIVVNRYLEETGDEEGFALLPFFIALRAAVRAHVTATQIEEMGGNETLEASAREYFDLAGAQLAGRKPLVMAIGGFSGSGKTTVSARLAPQIGLAPGALTLESDRVRKRMFGVPAAQRLPESAYLPEVGYLVYRELTERALRVASAGAPVIVNAVFAEAGTRASIEAAASKMAVPFLGIWLEAPEAALRKRVASRGPSASDADIAVLETQLGRDTGEISWRRIDANRPAEAIAGDIAALAGELAD